MAKISIAIVCVAATAWLMATGATAQGGEWYTGTAGYYGDMTGDETMGGACGYGDLFKQGYGLETAAVSTALFNDGVTCGACYEIQCYNDSRWCAPGSVTITATSICYPIYPIPGDHIGQCIPPSKHFDLSKPMFVKLVVKDNRMGIIPVRFRRVPCVKKGGIMFEMKKGDPDYIQVLVYNVGGAGDVTGVSVKPESSSSWLSMDREWGITWKTHQKLLGQSLSFEVATSDGGVLESNNIVPANWTFGQVFEGKQF